MKNLRNYNIYFHLHTISGIFACLLLFVIFFAGTFSFFKQESSAWQKGISYSSNAHTPIPIDPLVDSLATTKNLKGRNIDFYFVRNAPEMYVNVSASKDTTLKVKSQNIEKKNQRRGQRNNDEIYFKYDYVKSISSTYEKSYDMGEFLYRLHFLAPLNQIPIKLGRPFGYLLAGIVSFLFLFALITGLLLHWDKIISNFFTFRPWSKLKILWTDAHTALGVIGFPFQFMYAITGLYLIVNFVLISPFTQFLYEGKEDKLYADMGFRDIGEHEYLYDSIPQKISLESFVNDVKSKWADAELTSLQIKNFGDRSMHIIIEGNAPSYKSFAGSGKIIYEAVSRKIVEEKSVNSPATFVEKIRALILRLHFGDYGGYALKIIYFILGLMGCIVIISGMLIWYVARNKKSTSPHKKKFNYWTTNIFLTICLTMFPVTAITFIVVKIHGQSGQSYIYNLYFYTWLLFSVFYIIRNSFKAVSNETILVGSVISFLIPIVDGLVTQKWIWDLWKLGAVDILIFNLLWLSVSIVGLFGFYKIKKYRKNNLTTSLQKSI